jgi:hypothetical protein
MGIPSLQADDGDFGFSIIAADVPLDAGVVWDRINIGNAFMRQAKHAKFANFIAHEKGLLSF